MRRLPQLDPDDAPSQPIHCFGCGRLIGVAPDIKSASYCTELCRHQQQLITLDNAARNRSIQYLVDTVGLTMTAVGEAFGLTRTTVSEIVVGGNNGDYLKTGRKAPVTARERADRSRAGKASAAQRWGAE